MIKERQTGTSKLKAQRARRARVYVGLAGSVDVPSKSTLDFHSRVSSIFAAKAHLLDTYRPRSEATEQGKTESASAAYWHRMVGV